MKKAVVLLLCIVLISSVIAGCGGSQAPAASAASPETQAAVTQAATAAGAETTAAAAAAAKKFKIGYDIYWLGNTWSVMFAEEFKNAVQQPEFKDIVEPVYTESENDTNKMMNNIEDLITQKCDAIIVTPTSPTALNPVFKKAKAAGIKVVLNATLVDDPEAYDALVYFDNYDISHLRMEWLAKKLNYQGNVLEITGIDGYAANTDSVKGHKEIIDKYPKMKLIGQVVGKWDYATTKTEMANALNAYPQIDGIACQNGDSARGAIEAMEEAKRPLVPTMGEDNNGFLKKWVAIREKQKSNDPEYAKFDACAFAMPVYISATALKVTVDLLQGKTVQFEQNYRFPKAVLEKGPGLILSDRLDQFVKPKLPDGMNTVTRLSDEQLNKIFATSK